MLTLTGWIQSVEAFGKDPAGEKMRDLGRSWCSFEFLPRHVQRANPRSAIVARPDWKGPSYGTCCEAGGLWRHYGNSWRLDIGWNKHKIAKVLPPPVAIRLLKEAERKDWKDTDLRREVQRIRSPYQLKPLETDIVTDVAMLLRRGDKFNVIYLDPAWWFGDSQKPRGGSAKHYPAILPDALRALPIRQLALDTAFLLMWVPASLLPDALEVMMAWEFTYKTHGFWDKTVMGCGAYFRMEHEDLLLGVLPGSGTFVERLPSIIRAPRGIHSAKPEELYAMIERAVPGGPYLELFATKPVGRLNWTACGNMIRKTLPETDE